MKVSSLYDIIIESNKISSIKKHYIYNKYSTFVTKNKINNFRNIVYFLKDNFNEELSFIKKEQLLSLIKILLSNASYYKLSVNKKKIQLNQVKTSQFDYNYIIHYLKNEFKLYDITNKNVIFKLDKIKNLYKFIKFMDNNYFSLMEIENYNNIFKINILAFFYDEKFDIYKTIENYSGEIIE